MAKAFLIRWGSQSDFDSIKLQTRELGYAIDTIRLFIGSEDANIHIPNEEYMRATILSEVPKYKITRGTDLELTTSQLPGALGYSIDNSKLSYKTTTGTVKPLAFSADIPAKTGLTVTVEASNIEILDNNSVTLTNYDRPIELIYLNGKLCTTSANDINRYMVDSGLKTLKINGCAEGDLITYF